MYSSRSAALRPRSDAITHRFPPGFFTRRVEPYKRDNLCSMTGAARWSTGSVARPQPPRCMHKAAALCASTLLVQSAYSAGMMSR